MTDLRPPAEDPTAAVTLPGGSSVDAATDAATDADEGRPLPLLEQLLAGDPEVLSVRDEQDLPAARRGVLGAALGAARGRAARTRLPAVTDPTDDDPEDRPLPLLEQLMARDPAELFGRDDDPAFRRPGALEVALGVARGWGRRTWLLAGGALALIAALVVVSVVVLSSGGSPPHVASAVAVQHPEDGVLTVGTTTITQIAGSCSGSQCQYPTPPQAQTVHAVAGTLPLHAGKSAAFPGVSAFNLANPSAPAPFTVSAGRLSFAAAKPGTYRVTLIGSSGGTWQFTVVVEAG